MNFYIVDNEPVTVPVLKQVIEKNFDNAVLGVTSNPQQAYDDAMRLSIDIMFINLAITPIDGVELIKMIQTSHHHPHFILFGKNFSEEKRTAAYAAGADLLLYEPLNRAELKSVIRSTAENIQMSNRLLKILDMVSGAANQNSEHYSYKVKEEHKAQSILSFLGITSGAGTPDIVKLVKMMIEQEVYFESLDIMQIYNCSKREKKVILQRIRRDLKKGLHNLANMCIQYPDDEVIMEYANNLFEFTNVQNEILFIQQKRTTGGRIKVEQFFDGLLQEIKKH